MAEHSDVINRHDSSIRGEGSPAAGRRRRSFVAAPTGKPASAAAPVPEREDEDLPVLTEVVIAEAAASQDNTKHFDETLASEMAHAIAQQMSFELPTLVEATLLSVSEELRTGINSTMEAALRDFIAQRKQQLLLPLGEPDNSK
jgi:hypothetical protein